jgi:hypothetical protein
MAGALKFKPADQCVRIIYSDDPGGVDSVKSNPGKVFAVIGPFEGHTDKQDLMDAIETFLLGYNLEAR